MISTSLSIVFAALAAAATPTEGAARSLRLAVYDLEVEGIDPRVAKVVTEALLSELRKLDHTSVLAMTEVKAMLDIEAQKQLLGCSDTSCLAEIADSLGVDGLVIGKLLTLGDSHVIALKRLDQRNATATSFSRNLTPAGGEEFLAVIGAAVEELFPDAPLRKGATRGVAPELAIRLNPPPLPPWVFWSSLGVTAASGLVAGGALGLNLLEGSKNAELRGQSTMLLATWNDSVESTNTAASIAWVAAGVTVALAIGTAVTIPFTDWTGAGEEGP